MHEAEPRHNKINAMVHTAGAGLNRKPDEKLQAESLNSQRPLAAKNGKTSTETAKIATNHDLNKNNHNCHAVLQA